MKSIVTDEAMLQEPVDRGVRLVAVSLLEDAQKTAEKLTGLSKELRDGDTDGDEAVHDFRVAIRRLRSWIRAFKPWLRDDLRRKQRRLGRERHIAVAAHPVAATSHRRLRKYEIDRD